MRAHLPHDILRSEKLRKRAEAAEPSEKLRADDDVGADEKVLAAVGNQNHVPAQPVEHRADELVGKAHAHMRLRAAEHAKDLPGVNGHVERLIGLLAVARNAGDGDLDHLVHTEMLDDGGSGVVGEKVVVLVVPGEGEGTDLVKAAVVAVMPFLGNGVVKVAEADLSVLGNAALPPVLAV